MTDGRGLKPWCARRTASKLPRPTCSGGVRASSSERDSRAKSASTWRILCATARCSNRRVRRHFCSSKTLRRKKRSSAHWAFCRGNGSGGIIWRSSARPQSEAHACDCRKISQPPAEEPEGDGVASDKRPSSRDSFQRDCRSRRGLALSRCVCRHGRSGNRGAQPGSPGSGVHRKPCPGGCADREESRVFGTAHGGACPCSRCRTRVAAACGRSRGETQRL